jgi:uncharacterized protein YgbK (DUF1537 family)
VITLIADDLTGASDAGVQFARRGLITRVVFDISGDMHGLDAVALDTETRARPPDEAYARVRQAAGVLRTLQPDRVYKKVDSTLRGNLGVEIDAVMDAFEFSIAVVAPAFPALGRTTQRGVHLLRGSPVHETEVGRDPKRPVRESHLVRLLAAESRRAVGHIDGEIVACGPEAVRGRVENLAASGVSIVICDATDDPALRSIAESVAGRRDVLWVGSAGLAEHLIPAHGLVTSAPRAIDETRRGPILTVVGSLSEMTRRQVSALHSARDVTVVEIEPTRIFDVETCEAEVSRCRDAVVGALDEGRDVALVSGARRPRSDHTEGVEHIADVLGAIAADGARARQLGGLILTGGDTARAVCRQLGITGIQLISEVESGVPLGFLVGNPAARLPVVTKAGAFGSDATLVRALDRLKGER